MQSFRINARPGSPTPRRAGAILAALAMCGLPSNVRAEGLAKADSELRPIAWCAAEAASGHISIGRVKATHPVQNFEAKLGAEYAPLGYATAGVWSLTDLSRAYRDSRSAFWNEVDPVVTAGRRQALAEGYALDASVGAQWNEMVGYRGDARRSYDEWQMATSLTTPLVTPWFAMRNFYWPVAKASFRVGVTRSFRLTENLSLAPNVWLDGGSERWNRQRFGYRCPERIGQGVNSLSARLFAVYRLHAHAELYGGATGYCVTDPDVRAELKDNPSDEARHLHVVFTCGVKLAF